MNYPLRIFAVALLATVASCKDQPTLPTGANYVLNSQPKVAINHNGPTWQVYIESDNAYRLANVGITVEETANGEIELPVDGTLSGGESLGLPAKFRLNDEMKAGISCTGCSVGQGNWIRQVVP